MEQKELLLEYMEYRCSVYYSLKTIFVKEATMAQIRQIVKSCKKAECFEGMSEAERAYIEYFSSVEEEQVKEIRQEMKPEYARLFLGPNKLIAPPYESVYRSNNQCMFGKETNHVKQFYINAGMELKEKVKVPEDFIGTELEFMYWMSHRMYQAIQNDEDALAIKMAVYQYEFLKQHLTQWVPMFVKDVVEGTTMDYFKVAASYLEAFLTEDISFLESFN